MSVLAPARLFELERIRESGAFDREWYADRYPDVAALGIDPVEHYVWLGAALGRDPAAGFSTRFYLDEYPDVAKAGINPLFHYVSSGRDEGRLPLPLGTDRDRADLSNRRVEFRLEKTARISADEPWLVYVAYSADGRLTACQEYQLNSFRGAGYRVALVVNSGDFGNLASPGADQADIRIVRENVGFDFGAWRHAVAILGGLSEARSVTFTNDSILPVGGPNAIRKLRQRVERTGADVLFMTDNRELRPHAQSYFFRFGRRALFSGALSVVANIPYHADKDSLIHQVELGLRDRFEQAGLSAKTLFALDGVDENPTIHHWEQLLDAGLPFLKVQLITAGIVDIGDERLKCRLDHEVHGWLAEHCAARGSASPVEAASRNAPPVSALAIEGRFNDHGAQQAFNLPPAQNPTVKLPLAGIEAGAVSIPRILTVIHGFYVDIAADLLGQLGRLDIPMTVVVTTDSAEKAAAITAAIELHGLTGEAVIAPNRGRDVAPFLIEGGRFASEADLVLHLHTKKSPHDSIYAGWGRFLYDNLVGSRDVVLSILKMFEETNVGLVYSDHFEPVVGLRNWGYDFEHARKLLAGLGVPIGADDTLEFPTSTMFWARREALDPLFEAGLAYSDFDEEAGQIDGTLAHAIERSFVYVTQAAGFSCAKVTTFDAPNETGSPLLRLRPSDLAQALDRPDRYLPGDATVRSDFYRALPEIYPVSVARSRSRKRRLTALLPTMQPAKIYGGITTALKVIGQLVDALPDDISLRVLITSDKVDQASVEELGRRLHRSFALAMPDDDVDGDTIVGMAEYQHVPVSLRAGELYIATAWWTADLGYRLLQRQREMHGSTPRLAYIIQDYEPGFYNWSNTYALAEATYQHRDETLAIVNSEELSNYMLARYAFAASYCVPYRINHRLGELIEASEPDPLILVYGRPGVSRNCFELLCEGLRLWQSRNPNHSEYQIVFAGEDFEPEKLAGIVNARSAGKLTLDDYAATLNRAAIGVSLVVSPHPSYPPLEMASAGCLTITNAYEGKDLSRRADNIISLQALTPQCLADSIDSAVARVVYGQKKQLSGIKDLDSVAPMVDFGRIADWMLGAK